MIEEAIVFYGYTEPAPGQWGLTVEMIETFSLPQDSKHELGYFYTETEQGMLFHLCTAFYQAGDTIPTKFDATIQEHWAGLLRAYAEALHIDLGNVQPAWYLVAM